MQWLLMSINVVSMAFEMYILRNDNFADSLPNMYR